MAPKPSKSFQPSATPTGKMYYTDAVVKLLSAVNCKLDKIFEALGSLGGQGQVVVNVQPPRSLNASWGHVVIGTSPTKIRGLNPNRQSISIVNGGAATVYLGTSDVVTANTGTNPGYELLAQSTFDDDAYVGDIYGVVAAGTITITFWEE